MHASVSSCRVVVAGVVLGACGAFACGSSDRASTGAPAADAAITAQAGVDATNPEVDAAGQRDLDAGAMADIGVGADAAADAHICTAAELASLEQQIQAGLDQAASDPNITSVADFSVLLNTADGRDFRYAHANSTPATSYESASTSKLVAAVVILDLVDRGLLTLESRAQDLIPFWQSSAITLRQLLSFTSGLTQEPLCLNLPNGNFDNCVQNIYTQNKDLGIAPGSEFYYASTHLQVAGLMAIKATGKASWKEIFDDFRTRTGLFPNGSFDLPSDTNPRLAGGMHWTGEEYLAFLEALQRGALLSDAMRHELFANQRGSATVAYSPALGKNDERGVGEDWAYGLGNWLECETAKTAGSFDCGSGHRNSSPGAYGAYPFLDFDHHYVGLVARQGRLGSYPEGVLLFRAVRDLVNAWADQRCP